MRTEFPFEQVPVLEVDGKFIPQSFAIVLHLADAFGMSALQYTIRSFFILVVFSIHRTTIGVASFWLGSWRLSDFLNYNNITFWCIQHNTLLVQ